MKIKIFTEGGIDIGLGHISRCSSIYNEAVSRGLQTELIVFGDILNSKFLSNYKVKYVDWLDKNYLENYINNNDYCIIDSYLASIDLYGTISNCSKKALFIDDTARLEYPEGIIVNPSFDIKGLKYKSNNRNTLLYGAEFIILRNPFINTKRNKINRIARKVLITMGGSDLRNLTPVLIGGICNKYPYIQFDIVVGNTSFNAEYIEKVKQNNIKFYGNIDEVYMKELMLESDFAITAAGQTIYELMATQTPFIPIKIIDNQKNNILSLLKVNPKQTIIEYNDALLTEKLNSEFRRILDYNTRVEISNIYKNVIDGLGSKRIIDMLLKD